MQGHVLAFVSQKIYRAQQELLKDPHPPKFQLGKIVLTGGVRQRLQCEPNKMIEGKKTDKKPCGFIPLHTVYLNIEQFCLHLGKPNPCLSLPYKVCYIIKVLMCSLGNYKKMYEEMLTVKLCIIP